MPERKRIPEDDPMHPQQQPTDAGQRTQPYLPPELPDAETTRQQTVQDQTRYMQPVKDTRLNPTPQAGTASEKPKRDTGSTNPHPYSHPMNAPFEAEKPKRSPIAGYPPAQKRTARSNKNSPLRLPIWSVFLMLMLVVGATACVVVAIIGLGGRSAPTAPPEFVVVSAVPSVIPAVTIPSLLATPTLPEQFQQSGDDSNLMLAGPTLAPIIYTATPTPAPQITIGSTVVIIGNQGINIRNNPGTANGVVTIANPGEQFTVLDGPRQSNGLNWWQLSDTARGITGWAAENDGTTDLFQVVTP